MHHVMFLTCKKCVGREKTWERILKVVEAEKVLMVIHYYKHNVFSDIYYNTFSLENDGCVKFSLRTK